jgi:IclR family mhp operon transcriptional activator
MPSFEPVRAIVRGLNVLRTVSEQGPLTAMAVARGTGLPQPTIIRILETLIEEGYVDRMPDNARYRVTARTRTLSRGFDAEKRLIELAEPLLEELRAEIGWPSNLATFDRDAMVIAYTNRSAYGLSIPGRLGARIPLLATGVGIVQLASFAPDALAEVLDRLKHSSERWDHEPALWDSLDERLAAVRRDGFGFADERYLDALYQSQIWAVAVPVVVAGRMEAALSSLVLRSAGQRKRLLAAILPALRSTAAKLAAKIQADMSEKSTAG